MPTENRSLHKVEMTAFVYIVSGLPSIIYLLLSALYKPVVFSGISKMLMVHLNQV